MNFKQYHALRKVITFIVLLWQMSIVPVIAQKYLFDIEVIGVRDGLPNRNIYDVVQDKEGFIWVSALAAISRYDGYNFKTYDHEFLNISESSAAYLAVDGANRLWYCEAYNSSLYSGVIDTRKDTVYTMETISKGRFTSKDVLYICNSRTNKNDIFIAVRSGSIYRYNGAFEEIYRFPHPLVYPVLCEAAPDGSYWIIHEEAINVKGGKKLRSLKFMDAKKEMEGTTRIVSVHPDLILEMYGANTDRFLKLEKDVFVPFSVKGQRPDDMEGLFQLHKDYNIYTTKDTLFISDKQGDILYASDAFEFLMFRQMGYHHPLLDRQNTLWVPTGGGLLKINAGKTPFDILEPGNSIRGIFKDDEQLWTGGYSGNIVSSTASGTRKEFFPPTIVVTSVYKDDGGRIWIGSDADYLIAYTPGRDTYTEYESYRFNNGNSSHLPFQNAVTKNYWLGTDNGLFRFDPAHKKVTLFALPVSPKDTNIRQFYQNKKGIWIVTNKGIFLMDAEKETLLEHYTTAAGLPTNNINHIYEDKSGIFWIGTKGSGLIRWDAAAGSFHSYTREDGLSNNTIYAVYEDDYETLWMPSDYGLMAFDKNTATVRVYLPQNGIAHEEFNTLAHFQDKDGTLYFGGLNGITRFHPKNLRREDTIAPPLYVNKVSVLEKDRKDFTDKTAAYKATRAIRLNPGDRMLELELALLDYRNSNENQYAYKLTGRQEQWVYTGENKISIINPPYGRYELVIRARDASGRWSDNILTLLVYAPLPFYLQWWFVAIAVIATIFAFMLINKRRLRKLRKDRAHLEEEVRKRTQKIERDKQTIETQAEALKVLDKAKMHFFTNITHEFRTPLTLIIGPLEQIMAKSVPESLKRPIQTVSNNARHLLELINQLLDISKLESGQTEIKASTTDVVAFIGELIQGFQPLAREKKQRLVFVPALPKWETHFDPEKLSKIAYNMLSNAIKYTPKHGLIELSLSKNEDHAKAYIEIRIKDTGIGIAPDILPHIFNRFYQADDSTTRKIGGTGIGLALVKELVELLSGEITVESTLRKGTVFMVTLPVLAAPLHPDTIPEIIEPGLPGAAHIEIVPGEKPGDLPEEDKLRLLIIEDNTDMRRYIRSCIDTGRYRITEAADGLAGVKKAREIVPDLIISDVMMPKKDGFEVTRAIRNHIITSHIPLILLTAKASEESRLEGISRGADVYLTKPFSPRELNLRIKKLIEIRQLMQRRYQTPGALEENTAFKTEDRFIAELKNYISEHINDPSLSGGALISRHFAMSRMQLYRKLKALLNSDISSYVRVVRLETAMRLLKEKRLSVTEVAYETGFSSPNHFSRAFKKAYGKPPSQIQSQ